MIYIYIVDIMCKTHFCTARLLPGRASLAQVITIYGNPDPLDWFEKSNRGDHQAFLKSQLQQWLDCETTIVDGNGMFCFRGFPRFQEAMAIEQLRSYCIICYISSISSNSIVKYIWVNYNKLTATSPWMMVNVRLTNHKWLNLSGECFMTRYSDI
jgi:hypothetical protein